MTKRQSDAVKARVETVPALTGRTFKSMAPNGTPTPYAVLHSAEGEDTADRLAGGNRTMHPRFTLWIVGATADQVEVLTGLTKKTFVDADGYGIPLTVAGESCESLWWSAPQPIQVDSDPQPSIAYSVIELGWEANPI